MKSILLAGILISSLIPNTINSPKDLGEWLENHFTYQAEEEGKDYWQSPEETIKLKTFDCEDAAFLVQAVLNTLNYYTQVIVIVGNFDNKLGAHAICLFKNKNNKWEHFSNTTYFMTEFDNILDLIKYYYPKYKYYYTITFEDRPNK